MINKFLSLKLLKNARTELLILAIITIISTYVVTKYISNTQILFDSFILSGDYTKCIFSLAIICGVRIIQIIIRQFQTYVETRIRGKMANNIEQEMYQTIYPRTITNIETFNYQNDLQSITYGVNTIAQLFLSSITVLQNLILIIVYAYILFSQLWFLPLIVLIYNVPKIISDVKLSKIKFLYVEQNSDLSRQKAHYSHFFTKPDAQKEIIVFFLRDYLFTKWNKLAQKLFFVEIKQKKKELMLSSTLSIIAPIGYFITQFILLIYVFNKVITFGNYMSLTTTVSLLEASLFSISPIVGNTSQLTTFKKKMDDFYKRYLNNPIITKFECVEKIETIRLNNLIFKYPNSDSLVLKNINLKISLGDVVVILGGNGSGKSTLGKVLVGLHEVPEGTLVFNDYDVNSIDRHDLYKNVSIVTQDFNKFPFPIIENITSSNDYDTSKLNELVNKYPYLIPKDLFENTETLLGIDFLGSRQLSGGQWQRIAIARALYKQSSILLLDEATSAIDPETELKLINEIVQSRKDRITIIITHRVDLAKYANRILVMKHGKISELSNYSDLLDAMNSKENIIRSNENEIRSFSGAI
ncbi:ATP-binding cassette domain-containing protein [Paenibacillus sp. NPDC056579]|uniref:ATP-binding cassette domain-containing protein n=1 Tax=Paenibacillus sp. NPDC056579 TaxID=3345871 RepID=UPI0036BFDA7B